MFLPSAELRDFIAYTRNTVVSSTIWSGTTSPGAIGTTWNSRATGTSFQVSSGELRSSCTQSFLLLLLIIIIITIAQVKKGVEDFSENLCQVLSAGFLANILNPIHVHGEIVGNL